MMGTIKRAVTRWRRPQGWDRRQAGNAARDAKDWIAASDAYGDYLALNPGDGAIWVQCGHARKEAGDLIGAERAYRRAVEIDRDNPDPTFQLGVLMKRLDRRDDAIRCYRRSAALGLEAAVGELATLGVTYQPGENGGPDPSSAMLLRTLLDAQAARDQHQWAEAERLYVAFLRASPDAPQVAAELAAARRAGQP